MYILNDVWLNMHLSLQKFIMNLYTRQNLENKPKHCKSPQVNKLFNAHCIIIHHYLFIPIHEDEFTPLYMLFSLPIPKMMFSFLFVFEILQWVFVDLGLTRNDILHGLLKHYLISSQKPVFYVKYYGNLGVSF